MRNHRQYWNKHAHTHTRTACFSQTVDRQSAYPLPPLILEPSLRNTAPTWNSLASLPGLPSGSVLCVCVWVREREWRKTVCLISSSSQLYSQVLPLTHTRISFSVLFRYGKSRPLLFFVLKCSLETETEIVGLRLFRLSLAWLVFEKSVFWMQVGGFSSPHFPFFFFLPQQKWTLSQFKQFGRQIVNKVKCKKHSEEV